MVGGSVRDLVMGSEPKDLDLVTTATLHQISRLLRPRFRTSIVGRKFPIAIVNIEGQLVEISSMASSADGKQHQMVFDTNHMIRQMTKVDATHLTYAQHTVQAHQCTCCTCCCMFGKSQLG